MLQYVANGVCTSALYALVALGFGLAFSVARTFHIAHGAVFVAGGYGCYVFLIGLGWPLSAAVLAGLLAGTLLGMSIEAVVYYPLLSSRRPRPASAIIVMISSLGAYIVITNLLALLFGDETKVFRSGAEHSVAIVGVRITVIQLSQVIAGLCTVGAMSLLLHRTRLGKTLRALADDPELVGVMGHNVQVLRLAVFAIASVLCSGAGVLSALDAGIDPGAGLSAMLIGAVAVILSGRGRLLAPAVGAFLLGLVQSVVIWQTSAKWATAVVFGVLFLVLIFRPTGLFSFVNRAEEM